MILKKMYQKTQESIWKIGFIQNSIDDILKDEQLHIKYLSLPSDRWWADPFILDVTEKDIILLVEEYQYKRKRGTIAKLVIDKKTLEIKSDEEILVVDTHLSFPAILRKNKIYVYPENSKGGCLKLYRYDQETNKLVDGDVICSEPLTDAIYTEILGEPAIISTKEPNPNGKVLGLFFPKEENYGIVGNKYQLKEKIVFDEKIARNAGDWFEYKGKIYRPAQECNVEYGHSTYIQEVTKGINGKIHFNNIRILSSNDKEFQRGLHTFNTYKGLTVIDVKGYRYPIIAKFLKFIRNWI
jgi:hypothetical protein